jgi:hypothetical protein
LEAYVGIEAVRACIEEGVFEKPFDTKHTYVAFVDPSGGSNDSMTLLAVPPSRADPQGGSPASLPGFLMLPVLAVMLSVSISIRTIEHDLYS